jgi:hypothetical protein
MFLKETSETVISCHLNSDLGIFRAAAAWSHFFSEMDSLPAGAISHDSHGREEQAYKEQYNEYYRRRVRRWL